MVRADVDIHAHRQFAVVTAAIVAVILALYVRVVSLGVLGDNFLQAHGVVPNHLLSALQWRHPYTVLAALEPVLTALFLSTHWLHAGANVILMLLFGPSVEDRLGHYRFSLLFVVSGAAAFLAQSLMTPDSHMILVGAEGAVAGVGGACLAISPRGQVPTMMRGVEFPWMFGPVAWLLFAILITAAPLHPRADIGGVGLPYLLLAYGAGAALGPLYRHQRPVLLRG